MNNNSYICKFIKENSDWRERLSSYPFFIHIKESGDLAIFNYSLTETDKIEKDGEEVVARVDFTLPEVQESRGIIINTKTLDVVCWPFRKFGNFGESYIDDIDWNSACVQEKVDGSIMKLWYDKRPDYNMWRISTNGVIDAYDCTSQYGKVYGQMFFEAAEKQGLDLSKLDFNNTYIFELVSPFNRVVIEYPETMIYHTGTRNNITGKEYDVDIGIQRPKRYKLSSLEDCIEAAKELNIKEDNTKFDVKQEGFVVVDKNFHRIKIKSPEYVAVHHAFNGGILSRKRAVDMILSGDHEEYLTYFPQYEQVFSHLKAQMDKTETMIERYCTETEDIAVRDKLSRKDFAKAFGKDKLFGFGVSHVFDRNSIKDLAYQMTRKSWLKWIDTIDDFDFDKENRGVSSYVLNKEKDIDDKIH